VCQELDTARQSIAEASRKLALSNSGSSNLKGTQIMLDADYQKLQLSFTKMVE